MGDLSGDTSVGTVDVGTVDTTSGKGVDEAGMVSSVAEVAAFAIANEFGGPMSGLAAVAAVALATDPDAQAAAAELGGYGLGAAGFAGAIETGQDPSDFGLGSSPDEGGEDFGGGSDDGTADTSGGGDFGGGSDDGTGDAGGGGDPGGGSDDGGGGDAGGGGDSGGGDAGGGGDSGE